MNKPKIDQDVKEIEIILKTILNPKKSAKAGFNFSKPTFLSIEFKHITKEFLLTFDTTCDLSKYKCPLWLEISGNTPNFELRFPTVYSNEMVLLLLYFMTADRSSGDIDGKSGEIFKDWCKLMGAREPFSISEQKGIIGEIQSLIPAIKNYGVNAIIGWDRSNLRDIQITDGHGKEVLHIESKAHSPSSSDVKISERNQLEYLNDMPVVVLSVTEIQMTLNGQTLPDYLESVLLSLGKKDIASANLLRNHNVSTIILDNKDRFRTKFQIIDTQFFKIESLDPCDNIAKMDLPKNTDFRTWSLIINPCPLSTYYF
jgi:hypothetical protein